MKSVGLKSQAFSTEQFGASLSHESCGSMRLLGPNLEVCRWKLEGTFVPKKLRINVTLGQRMDSTRPPWFDFWFPDFATPRHGLTHCMFVSVGSRLTSSEQRPRLAALSLFPFRSRHTVPTLAPPVTRAASPGSKVPLDQAHAQTRIFKTFFFSALFKCWNKLQPRLLCGNCQKPSPVLKIPLWIGHRGNKTSLGMQAPLLLCATYVGTNALNELIC